LCDYAVVGADGAFTVIRGGTRRWETQALPAQALEYVLVEVDPGHLGPGDHPVTVSISGKDGVSLMDAKGTIKIKDPVQPARFVTAATVLVQTYDDHRLLVKVGDLVVDRTIPVVKVEVAP